MNTPQRDPDTNGENYKAGYAEGARVERFKVSRTFRRHLEKYARNTPERIVLQRVLAELAGVKV